MSKTSKGILCGVAIVFTIWSAIFYASAIALAKELNGFELHTD